MYTSHKAGTWPLAAKYQWQQWYLISGLRGSPGGGGGSGNGGSLPYKSDEEARGLAQRCTLQILVSLRVFGTENHYICPFRYCLGLCIKKFTKNAVISVLWSPLGLTLSLCHTHIGVPWGFHLSFPASIPVTFILDPPLPPSVKYHRAPFYNFRGFWEFTF